MMKSFSHDIQKRLLDCDTIPSLPQLAISLMNVLESPDCSDERLSNLFKQDVGIVVRILKAVNSPAYGLVRQVSCIEESIRLLGRNKCVLLALSFYFVQSFEKKSSLQLDYDYFFKRSLISATAARLLAKKCDFLVDLESVFLSALMQDIGIFVLSAVLGEEYCQQIHLNVYDHHFLKEAECIKLGCDHAYIAGWLLKQWNFPSSMCDAVRHSHDVQFAANEFSACVALSGCIADIYVHPNESKALLIQKAEAAFLQSPYLPQLNIMQLLIDLHQPLMQVSDWFDQPELAVVCDHVFKEITDKASGLALRYS